MPINACLIHSVTGSLDSEALRCFRYMCLPIMSKKVSIENMPSLSNWDSRTALLPTAAAGEKTALNPNHLWSICHYVFLLLHRVVKSKGLRFKPRFKPSFPHSLAVWLTFLICRKGMVLVIPFSWVKADEMFSTVPALWYTLNTHLLKLWPLPCFSFLFIAVEHV